MASTSTAPGGGLASKYVKMDHHEHVLARPGMYIGSVEADTYNTWVFDEQAQRMHKRELRVVPGLYKIFDEILVNSVDHATRLKEMKASGNHEDVQLVRNIKVTIDRESGQVTVYNDGDGIEVELHPDHNVYIPELVFGTLLTSTNYNDEQEKTIGGQNGIGAKACNIFSKSFAVETLDAKRHRYYKQTWSDNMRAKTKATVKAKPTGKPYTQITFHPDYARFNATTLDDDMYALFVKRVYDLCALTDTDVNVYLNGTKLEFKSFERYVDLYLGNKEEHPRVYEKVNDRWEVVAASSDALGFDQVSFVNGIWTIRGGKHVDYLANQVATQLADAANKRRKDAGIKALHIKNHLMLFVKCTISNPTFDSQTKDLLTTPATKFGSRAELSAKFMEKLAKTDLLDKATALADTSTQKALKKTDGRKSSKIRGMVKLDDANFAGTSKSAQCTLILTEGDSAKATALAGLAKIGRDLYGVFPLRGKLLNVKDVSIKKLSENEEIQAIKKILGLESGKTYSSLSELRYGRIMIMSDQDHDGSHIRGLIMNLFHTLWPSLVTTAGFVTSLLTPIIKVTHAHGNAQHCFYNMSDYEKWLAEVSATEGGMRHWTIKYYKGLGTSTEQEAVSYFTNMHMVEYSLDKESADAMDLAFNKKRADDRKVWLSAADPASCNRYDEAVTKVSYKDFVDRELVHFSVYDVKRSIPSLVDGLKPSQRKILFCCLKRNLTKETKVAQLSGYVSEHAAYHHGEASLQAAIIGMAQDFVGSNNLNLLKPNGQFGSRIMGGKDASAPRYIFTELQPLTAKVFRKEDEGVLTYLDDDGLSVEPEHYVPIIPMVLINGAVGIGTGFSTNVPSFNPLEVVAACKAMIQDGGATRSVPDLVPWTRGFTGTWQRSSSSAGAAFTCSGAYRRVGDRSIEITELPVGTWTEDYKAFLEEQLEKGKVLRDYESHYTTRDVRFVLHFHEAEAAESFNEKDWKLSKQATTTNMHLFDANGSIKKYANVHQILEEFYAVRLRYYQLRKEHVLRAWRHDMVVMAAKRRFIELVIVRKLALLGEKRAALEAALQRLEFPRVDATYDYLLGMPIHTLTAERAEALAAEVTALEARLRKYETQTVEQMWLAELEELEQELQAQEQRASQAPSTEPAQKRRVKLQQPAAKSKKSKLLEAPPASTADQ